MSVATDQNFNVFRGDDVSPIFTVLDGAGAAIDLSLFLEVQWLAYFDPVVTPSVINKKKTTGGVTFVSDGKDGKVQVLLSKTDTTALKMGWMAHSVVVTDGQGNVTTVALGRFSILDRGIM